MVYSEYTRLRIIFYHQKGLSSAAIAEKVRSEGMDISAVGVWKLLRSYKETGIIQRQPGSGRPSLVTAEIAAIIERQMQLDDETTATQLRAILEAKGHKLSLSTIQRSRHQLGWTFRGSAYCQLIRDANKRKRLDWARDNLTVALSDGFTNVIWTDKSSIQLDCHRRHCFRKAGCVPKPKPR